MQSNLKNGTRLDAKHGRLPCLGLRTFGPSLTQLKNRATSYRNHQNQHRENASLIYPADILAIGLLNDIYIMIHMQESASSSSESLTSLQINRRQGETENSTISINSYS